MMSTKRSLIKSMENNWEAVNVKVNKSKANKTIYMTENGLAVLATVVPLITGWYTKVMPNDDKILQWQA